MEESDEHRATHVNDCPYSVYRAKGCLFSLSLRAYVEQIDTRKGGSWQKENEREEYTRHEEKLAEREDLYSHENPSISMGQGSARDVYLVESKRCLYG